MNSQVEAKALLVLKKIDQLAIRIEHLTRDPRDEVIHATAEALIDQLHTLSEEVKSLLFKKYEVSDEETKN